MLHVHSSGLTLHDSVSPIKVFMLPLFLEYVNYETFIWLGFFSSKKFYSTLSLWLQREESSFQFEL